jgi:hypothetical protein
MILNSDLTGAVLTFCNKQTECFLQKHTYKLFFYMYNSP